ncbi:MAG: bifunctional diaminohydroxyphosphoribosylaminopyrimidine deaminase/5-amino-6-(5-phosphoribosylamino)uracil reductase RibD [Intestinimonas sp.]|nr:bifunctional diaminohydroxyphosphoribosylaminopyrimidine deaminase/5-amino-6-(5-phosphoribosylamino)uracil reductase RibD [Intestinimonas sp.]
MTHEDYMRMAISQAEKGCGWTNPNPMVGAVIVKDGRVISRDYHHRCGEYHAERNAILNCPESTEGATLYVTLEPCCHYGRTPPCTQIILKSGITTVVVGAEDPNPLVAGKGIALLRQAGLAVITGVLEAECRKLNRVFFHYVRTHTPYVVMKYAITADGKIATRTGASRWITGKAARRHVQMSRNRYSAIMVGVGTVLADDPRLTCRLPGGRNPVRVVCDTNLRTPLTANVVTTAEEIPTILATCCGEKERHRPYRNRGCQVLVLPRRGGHVDLAELMARLGGQELDSVLLEGGAALNFSALQCGVVDRVQAYVAPKIFGGTDAKSPVGGAGVALPDEAFGLNGPPEVTVLEEDVLLEWEVPGSCLRGL